MSGNTKPNVQPVVDDFRPINTLSSDEQNRKFLDMLNVLEDGMKHGKSENGVSLKNIPKEMVWSRPAFVRSKDYDKHIDAKNKDMLSCLYLLDMNGEPVHLVLRNLDAEHNGLIERIKSGEYKGRFVVYSAHDLGDESTPTKGKEITERELLLMIARTKQELLKQGNQVYAKCRKCGDAYCGVADGVQDVDNTNLWAASLKGIPASQISFEKIGLYQSDETEKIPWFENRPKDVWNAMRNRQCMERVVLKCGDRYVRLYVPQDAISYDAKKNTYQVNVPWLYYKNENVYADVADGKGNGPVVKCTLAELAEYVARANRMRDASERLGDVAADCEGGWNMSLQQCFSGHAVWNGMRFASGVPYASELEKEGYTDDLHTMRVYGLFTNAVDSEWDATYSVDRKTGKHVGYRPTVSGIRAMDVYVDHGRPRIAKKVDLVKFDDSLPTTSVVMDVLKRQFDDPIRREEMSVMFDKYAGELGKTDEATLSKRKRFLYKTLNEDAGLPVSENENSNHSVLEAAIGNHLVHEVEPILNAMGCHLDTQYQMTTQVEKLMGDSYADYVKELKNNFDYTDWVDDNDCVKNVRSDFSIVMDDTDQLIGSMETDGDVHHIDVNADDDTVVEEFYRTTQQRLSADAVRRQVKATRSSDALKDELSKKLGIDVPLHLPAEDGTDYKVAIVQWLNKAAQNPQVQAYFASHEGSKDEFSTLLMEYANKRVKSVDERMKALDDVLPDFVGGAYCETRDNGSPMYVIKCPWTAEM